MKSRASRRLGDQAVPPLSVVMPVRNSLRYLDEAIEAILSQSFGDFEFVILDDASGDGSGERLRNWAARDERIRLFGVEEPLGPAGSSNFVASRARAPVVARMDADDLCDPGRLAEQLEVLRRNPQAALVASLSNVIDSEGRPLRGPETWRLLRRSPMVPFAHGAIMYRRKLFDELGGYRGECAFWEDQDLITRMASVGEILVIPKALYTVRLTTTSTRAASEQERLEQALDRMYRIQASSTGEDPESGRAGSKVDPRVFVSLGSVSLWAGAKPRLFHRLLERANLRADLASAGAIVWAAWASLNPATLRMFLKAHARLRNLAAGRLPPDKPVRWSPEGKAAARRA